MTLSDETPANPADSTGPGRRRFLYGGVAAAAAAAGAGVAWWKFQAAGTGRDAAAALWSLSFDTPAGATLTMQSLRGKPLVLNFWATWCPPCVEELPLLDAFYKQNAPKSWQVVGLAIDQPSAVRKFLERTPVSFPIGMAGMGGTELGHAFGNLAGGLPFTVVLSASGDVLQRKMGRITPADLAMWTQVG
jgi:thiol-disulfide isomerase/thioredoxin